MTTETQSTRAGDGNSRERFEAYFLDSRKSKGAGRAPTFERFPDDTYKDDHTQRHWWTWQQAIAAAPAAAPAQRVCHMECDGCISSGKCAHAERARRSADHDQWMNDFFTLVGDAELRRSAGETDMPNYLLELAGRIAKAHLDESYVKRASELRAAGIPSPVTGDAA